MATDQITIESLGKRLARIQRAMARNFSPSVEKRLANFNALCEQLPLGQQLAVLTIANRINDEN